MHRIICNPGPNIQFGELERKGQVEVLNFKNKLIKRSTLFKKSFTLDNVSKRKLAALEFWIELEIYKFVFFQGRKT